MSEKTKIQEREQEMKHLYVLDKDKNAIPVDHEVWCKWIRKNGIGSGKFDNVMRVGKTIVGDYIVSTVFLAMNHNFNGDVPLIFETMVFIETGGQIDYIKRYSTWKDAVDGHDETVRSVKKMFDIREEMIRDWRAMNQR